MKAKSLVVVGLVVGGMFVGAGSAFAEDDIAVLPKPVCAENEYIDFDDAGNPFCTVVSTTAEEEMSVDPCWVTEDGVDVCARGFVTSEEPMPIDETCTATINEDGTESTVCYDIMASTGMVPGEETLGGVPMDDQMRILEKGYSLTSAQSSTDGTLAFLGLFFGLLGGTVIALKNKPLTK